MSKSPDVRIVLVRCGRTEWDAEERICGSADVPPCEGGVDAALESFRDVGEDTFGVVLHGPDEASRETAKAIARDRGVKTRELDALGEMNLGLWEGLREQEFAERYPTASRGWREDPVSVSVPEGETLGAADERIIGELAKALEKSKHDGAAVVVLRPIAFGLVNAWLKGVPMGDWRQASEEVGDSTIYITPRADLKGARDRARTSA